MNKKLIESTRTIHFSDVDDGYVITSPLFQHIVGFGETKEEALQVFANHAQKKYADYLEERIDGPKRSGKGRPAKGLISLDANVRQETRQWANAVASKLGISLGEVIDMAMFCLVFQSKVVEPVLDSKELNKIEKQLKKNKKLSARTSPAGEIHSCA
jgi:predicted RNase H-like HicB family nuclease/antitoxin component of RelBE/YafQ-DinJ toxin-antitoxin module